MPFKKLDAQIQPTNIPEIWKKLPSKQTCRKFHFQLYGYLVHQVDSMKTTKVPDKLK